MAPRANWKGFLRLSLVSCPIALYPASSLSEKVSFNRINRKTRNRLKQQNVDSETGEVVPREDIARGYSNAGPRSPQAIRFRSRRRHGSDRSQAKAFQLRLDLWKAGFLFRQIISAKSNARTCPGNTCGVLFFGSAGLIAEAGPVERPELVATRLCQIARQEVALVVDQTFHQWQADAQMPDRAGRGQIRVDARHGLHGQAPWSGSRARARVVRRQPGSRRAVACALFRAGSGKMKGRPEKRLGTTGSRKERCG